MEENDTIDLSKYVHAIKRGWYWYLGAFVVLVGLAVVYHFVRMDNYETYGALLIEDDEGDNGGKMANMGGMASLMRTFSIGPVGANSIDNEILIFQSHNLMTKVIDRLQLNRVYVERDGLKKKSLYGISPVSVEAPKEFFDTISVGLKFKISLLGDNKADVEVVKGFFSKTVAEKKGAVLPVTISTDYGTFNVMKTAHYNPMEKRDITVSLVNTQAQYKALKDQVVIDFISKKSDGVEVVYEAPSKLMGKDLVNTIMELYNEIRLERKNESARQSLEFYDQQIAELSKVLFDSEDNISKFKRENNLVDIGAEVKANFTADKAIEKRLSELRIEIMFQDLILNFLKDEGNRYALLPLNDQAGAGASSLLQQYNSLIMQRMELEHSAKESNVVFKALTEQIDAMRGIVEETVARSKSNAEATVASINKERNVYQSRLGKMPEHEREYIDLMRDRELNNELYMFLVGKRSNYAMTLASKKTRGFIIEPAYCGIKPTNTKSFVALGVALVLSAVLPTIWILFLMLIRGNRKGDAEA